MNMRYIPLGILTGSLLLSNIFSLGEIRAHDPVRELPSTPAFLLGSDRLGHELLPESLTGATGDRISVSFFYSSPEDGLPGEQQFDQIQGLSMAICFDCRLRCLEETFAVPEHSIASAVGVDFVSFQSDNDPTDGDRCELALGLLVEATPPFVGTTLPPTHEPLRLATVEFQISEEVDCGETLAIEFCEGINASGKVPLYNVYSAENQSFEAVTFGTSVDVESAELFRRGDCNWDDGFSISDPISILNAVFFRDVFNFVPVCEDACDANDDGRLDLSDSMTLLYWLFLGGEEPPAPGVHEFGVDPTEDRLVCELPCVDLGE